MMVMVKKYYFFEWVISVNFKDVINIIIQLNSFEYKVIVILTIIIERFVDYIRNVHFKVDYIAFKLLANLFLIKYLKTLNY